MRSSRGFAVPQAIDFFVGREEKMHHRGHSAAEPQPNDTKKICASREDFDL